MKKPTYKQARETLLAYLAANGWTVRADLKTPHATSPDGLFRLWFKPQAVHTTTIGSPRLSHNAGDARSMWVDLRALSPEQFVIQAERWRGDYP